MTVSDTGRAMIKHYEGLSLSAYPDAGGYSIGYGHFGASPGQTITQAEAETLFNQDVRKVEEHLNSFDITLNQNQFDALADFIYNVGPGAFNNSTLLAKIKAGDYSGAASEFSRWIYSQGKKIPALIERRAAEAALFLKGVLQETATAAKNFPIATIAIVALILIGLKIIK